MIKCLKIYIVEHGSYVLYFTLHRVERNCYMDALKPLNQNFLNCYFGIVFYPMFNAKVISLIDKFIAKRDVVSFSYVSESISR